MRIPSNIDRPRAAEVEAAGRGGDSEKRKEAKVLQKTGAVISRRKRKQRMGVENEKERKAAGKGGHIVESRPGFLSVQLADKSLSVSCFTYQPLSPALLIPLLMSKHVPA